MEVLDKVHPCRASARTPCAADRSEAAQVSGTLVCISTSWLAIYAKVGPGVIRDAILAVLRRVFLDNQGLEDFDMSPFFANYGL